MIPLDLNEAKKLPQGIPVILVPFREQLLQKRGEQLKKFTSHMKRWHPDWPILIIEQYGDQKFNRGALLNIGTRYAQKLGAKYVVYHDVDLIPLSPIIPFYTAFPEKPIHIGGIYKDKYQGDSFIGQVLSISLIDVKNINGFPNMFWGWGGEDDAMRNRLKKKGLEVWKLDTDKGFKELPHIDTRTNKDWKNMRKWEDIREDTGKHGFNDIRWKVLEDSDFTTNIKKLTVEINI